MPCGWSTPTVAVCGVARVTSQTPRNQTPNDLAPRAVQECPRPTRSPCDCAPSLPEAPGGLPNSLLRCPASLRLADLLLMIDALPVSLYAWKVARHCNPEDMPYCMEVKVNGEPGKPFVDINGIPYACTLYDWHSSPGHPIPLGPFVLDEAEMFFLWRAYLEPATNVGPDDNELLYDRAIYFGPYFAGDRGRRQACGRRLHDDPCSRRPPVPVSGHAACTSHSIAGLDSSRQPAANSAGVR